MEAGQFNWPCIVIKSAAFFSHTSITMGDVPRNCHIKFPINSGVQDQLDFLIACTNMLLIFPGVREISAKQAFFHAIQGFGSLSLQTAFHQNTIFMQVQS